MSTDVYGARPARWLGVNRKLEVSQESGFISWKIHGTSNIQDFFMDDHWVYSTGFTVPGKSLNAKSKWMIDMAQWIGLRENLQETMVFTIKYRASL